MIGVRLRGLLALLLGSDSEAADMIADALHAACESRVPDDPEAADEFVRDHLLGRVTAATGPRLAATMLAELRGILGLGTDRPARRDTRASASFQHAVREWASTIAVVDGDAQRRAALARLLVQGGAAAATYETFGGVDLRESFDTAIVRITNHADLLGLARIAGATPGARFVAVTQIGVDPASLRGNASIEVVPAETPLAGIAAMALARVEACA